MDFKGDGYRLGKPTEYGVWVADYPVKESTNINQVYFGETFSSLSFSFVDSTGVNTGFVDQLGTLFTFAPNPDPNKPTSILARVGVSFISPEQACSNAETEIPDFDFEGTQASARAQWNELLGRIQVDTKDVDKESVELFYSSVNLFSSTIA